MSQHINALQAPSVFPDSSDPISTSSSTSSLKRRASDSFDFPGLGARKKMKEDFQASDKPTEMPRIDESSSFIEDIAQELQCGCCAELVYRPVLVMPCQHFFCGSCCTLWIRNGGTSCPACRGVAAVAMPFRAMQPVLDLLLRNAPHKERTLREREQADEVYKAGNTIRIPSPREASPPPDVERSTEYVYPCPHCLPNNPYDWRCPQPIPDPNSDPEHAWSVDNGIPPGHANCGNCETLLALRAPSTTKCDFCLVLFCGVGIQERCIAMPLLSQHPHNLSSHADLILSAEVYECFDGNTVEVEIMFEYLATHDISPRHIYRQIIQHIQSQPRGFAPLVELELFSDIHPTAPGQEPSGDPPRNRVCRMCAAEIFLWGLKEWWIRERRKGLLDASILNRKDCPEAGRCRRQKEDLGHAKEFNHLFSDHATDDVDAPATIVDAPLLHQEAPTEPPLLVATPPLDPLPDLPPLPPVLPFAPSSSSSASLSFLLNADDDALSVPEFRASTPDEPEDRNAR